MREHAQGTPDHSTNDTVFLGVGSLYAHVGDYIGHFYRTQEEWQALLIPFLTTGLTAGDIGTAPSNRTLPVGRVIELLIHLPGVFPGKAKVRGDGL